MCWESEQLIAIVQTGVVTHTHTNTPTHFHETFGRRWDISALFTFTNQAGGERAKTKVWKQITERHPHYSQGGGKPTDRSCSPSAIVTKTRRPTPVAGVGFQLHWVRGWERSARGKWTRRITQNGRHILGVRSGVTTIRGGGEIWSREAERRRLQRNLKDESRTMEKYVFPLSSEDLLEDKLRNFVEICPPSPSHGEQHNITHTTLQTRSVWPYSQQLTTQNWSCNSGL